MNITVTTLKWRPALFVILLCGVLALNGCSTQSGPSIHSNDSFTITGHIRGINTGLVFLTHQQNDTNIVDSTDLKNGIFIFKGKVIEPCLYNLKFDNIQQELDFFVENKSIVITAFKDSIDKGEVKGSEVQNLFLTLQKIIDPFENQKTQLYPLYSLASKNNSPWLRDSLDKVWGNIDSSEKMAIISFCRTNPSSVVSAYAIFMKLIIRQIKTNYDSLSSLFQDLSVETRNSYYGKKIQKALAAAKKLKIGNYGPDFTEKDPDDKFVTLSALNGKIVFLDFWASWCSPCRVQNPSLVKLFNKYGGEKFAIISISFDIDKKSWINAIKKDSLTWYNISDLQTFYLNRIGQLYNIQGIPTNYLLNENRQIIGKDFSMDQLDSTLYNLAIK